MNIDVLEDGTRGKIKHKKNSDFLGITTDSRKDVHDKIFFALKGDVHDGHDYVEAAVKNGAGAVVFHTWNPAWQPLLKSATWVQVDDTLKALQYLAKFWRKKWGKKIIGVTGSNGKTSVKDFAHTLISGAMKTLKNQGSFNNHWGLPLTLLELNDQHEIAIVEMGMNHAGEIKALCQIAEPDISVVNNVGRAHIENFDSIEGIAKAKEEIYFGLKETGVGVFNLADPFTAKMLEEWRDEMATIVTFGTKDSDVYFELKEWTKSGLALSGQIQGLAGTATVPIWGEQNIINLMDAAALAVAAGVKPEVIWQGIPLCKTGWGRNQWVELKSGASLLFDAYNANPDSFAALFSNLAKMPTQPKQVIGVFSEMLEQGDMRDIVHFELGKLAAQSCVTETFFIGPSQSKFKAGFESVKSGKNLATSYTYEQSLALKIKSMLDTNSLVAVKGSRGGALERVVLELDPLNFTTK